MFSIIVLIDATCNIGRVALKLLKVQTMLNASTHVLEKVLQLISFLTSESIVARSICV